VNKNWSRRSNSIVTQ